MALYRVQVGDTAMSIAERLTGNPLRARELVIANPQKEWATEAGMLIFKDLKVGELLNIPESWKITYNIGVGSIPVGLGAPSLGDQITTVMSGGDFPLEKLTGAARQEVNRLTGNTETTNRLETAIGGIANIASGRPVEWKTIVSVTATIATVAAGPIAGAIVYGVGTAIDVLKPVLGDVIDFLGGSTPIQSSPADISMNCISAKDLQTGRIKPNPHIAYGFDDPGWWHVIDRNELKPGTESWNPQGTILINNQTYNLGPQAFTGNIFIYGPSGARIPNYDYFQYNNATTAMFWMFGVIFNELWRINATLETLVGKASNPTRKNELLFRKFFYSLLLRNWESRINCNVNINDRVLLSGAVGLWNSIHNNSSVKRYDPIYPDPPDNFLIGAAGGYCFYEYYIDKQSSYRPDFEGQCATRSGPTAWAITDISWSKTKSFIEFMLTGTFDITGRVAPININVGPIFIPKTKRPFETIKENLIKSSSGASIGIETSSTSKALIGTAVVGAIAAASLGYFAYSTGRTYTGAAKYIYKKTTDVFTKKRRKNPLMLPPGPSSTAIVPHQSSAIVPVKTISRSKRRVAYRVELGQNEYVTMLPDGSAVLHRYEKSIARFTPAHYQLSKIRSGEGKLLIYIDQILT